MPIALLVSGLVLTFAPMIVAEDGQGERQAAFQWFDSLGYPDLNNLPFVRVDTGEWEGTNDHQIPIIYYGWLISSSRDEFTVFQPDLDTRTFSRGGKDGPPTDFARIDLKKYGDTWLAQPDKFSYPIWRLRERPVNVRMMVVCGVGESGESTFFVTEGQGSDDGAPSGPGPKNTPLARAI